MTVSIKQHNKTFENRQEIELKRQFNAVLADMTAMNAELVLIGTTLADYKAIYDAHVHTADGNASRTSVPDSGTPTGSPSAASAFTDTSATVTLTLVE